jgi:hypothetical protein
MRYLLIQLSFILFLTTSLFGQSTERPETIVIPVSSLGEVSEVRKQILQNTLEDELKSHFRLISQEKYEEVLEKVFEELDYKECNEDQCIVMIQEMLQVENVFHLQVLGEGQDTQLSLSWRTLDEKRKETDICSGCGTIELSGIVMGLVGRLVGVEEEVLDKPVVVEKLQTGFLFWKFENDEYRWFKDGNEKNDGKYVGEIRNGVPNGQGTLTSPDGGKFEGEFKDGLLNGQGTVIFPDGEKYEGEFYEGQTHGQGTFTFSDGNKYEGEWKDGITWNITKYDKNGNITGKWVNGVLQE